MSAESPQQKHPVLKVTRLPPAQEAALYERYQVIDWSPGEPPPAGLEPVRAVVSSGGVGLPRILAEQLPNLELVAVNGVGVDAIDFEWTNSRGIRVTTTPGVLTEDVADIAIALYLSVMRRVVDGDRYVRDGGWEAGRPFPLARSASGRRVGLLGLGAIGKAIARRVEAFGCEVRYTTRTPVADAPWPHVPELRELADWAEVLIVQIPGGKKTAGIVSAEVLAALGPQGVLVNVARGEVVDQPALIEALQRGVLGAAGLDVFVNEPNVPQALRELPNVVLQPHVGSATEETRAAMANIVVNNVEAFFAGAEDRFVGLV